MKPESCLRRHKGIFQKPHIVKPTYDGTHSLLAPRSRKSRAIPLHPPPPQTFRSVTGTFTFTYDGNARDRNIFRFRQVPFHGGTWICILETVKVFRQRQISVIPRFQCTQSISKQRISLKNQVTLSLEIFPLELCTNFVSFPCVLHVSS
jgi:hypothetical protein